jgi:hypothetical protein
LIYWTLIELEKKSSLFHGFQIFEFFRMNWNPSESLAKLCMICFACRWNDYMIHTGLTKYLAADRSWWVQRGGGTPSYRNVAVNDRARTHAKRSAFESPLHLRDQLLSKEHGFNKAMDVEPNTSHPKASRGWEPGKCIP